MLSIAASDSLVKEGQDDFTPAEEASSWHSIRIRIAMRAQAFMALALQLYFHCRRPTSLPTHTPIVTPPEAVGTFPAIARGSGSVTGHFSTSQLQTTGVLQTTSGFSTHSRRVIVISSVTDPQ